MNEYIVPKNTSVENKQNFIVCSDKTKWLHTVVEHVQYARLYDLVKTHIVCNRNWLEKKRLLSNWQH